MQNEQLRHRINELGAQKAPFIQTPPGSTVPALGALAMQPRFSGNPSSITSSPPTQLPIDPASSTVPDHIGLRGNPIKPQPNHAELRSRWFPGRRSGRAGQEEGALCSMLGHSRHPHPNHVF